MPKDAAVLANLALSPAPEAHRRRHRHAGDRRLALKPDDDETLVSLGFAYRQKGDVPKAVTQPAEGDRRLKPDDAIAWNNLGVAKSRTDDKAGHHRVQEGPGTGPEQRRLSLQPGDRLPSPARDRAGHRRDQAALEHNPKLAGAYYDLGVLHAQARRQEEALTAFRNYLKYGINEDPKSRRTPRTGVKTLEAPSPRRRSTGADGPFPLRTDAEGRRAGSGRRWRPRYVTAGRRSRAAMATRRPR